MVITVDAGLPKIAFETSLKMRLNDSLPSTSESLIIATVKLFDDSPAANESVPFGPLKSFG